jgi:hypothetical protein
MGKRTVTMPDGTQYDLDNIDPNLTDRQIMDNVSAHHKKQNADAYAGVPSNYKDLVLESEKNSADFGGQKPGALKQFGLGMLHSLDKQVAGVTGLFGGNSDSTKKRLTQGEDFVKQYDTAASLGALTGDIGGDVASAIGTRGMSLLKRAGLQGLSSALRTPGDGGDRVVAGLMNAGGEGLGSLLSATLRGGLKVAEPFTTSGRDRIVNRTLNNSYSGEGDLLSAILRGNTEYIQGIKPTTAQTVLDPGISRLTDSMGSKFADVGNQLKGANTARTGAYESLLRDMAGDATNRARAETLRETAATADYAAAGATPLLRSDALDATSQRLLNLPSVKEAIPDALKLAEQNFYLNPANAGRTFDPSASGSVNGMHSIVDTLKGKADTAFKRDFNTGAATSIGNARDAVVSYLREASPLYGEAVDNYARNSRSLNQMDVGSYLYDKTFPPLVQSSGVPFRTLQDSFSRALRDSEKTVRSATGLKAKGLDEVLEPWQMDRLNAINLDMGRAAASEALGHGTGSQTAQRTADGLGLNVNGLLGNTARASGYMKGGLVGGQAVDSLMSTVANKVNGKVSNRLGSALVDPDLAASILRNTNMEPNWFMRNVAGKNTGLGIGSLGADATFNYMPNQYPQK